MSVLDKLTHVLFWILSFWLAFILLVLSLFSWVRQQLSPYYYSKSSRVSLIHHPVQLSLAIPPWVLSRHN